MISCKQIHMEEAMTKKHVQLRRGCSASLVVTCVLAPFWVSAQEPQPCASDRDCMSPRRCLVSESWACPDGFDGGCLPGESDEECVTNSRARRDAECRRDESQTCGPIWRVECEVDADCGADFVCEDHRGRCGLADASCHNDEDCPLDYVCIELAPGAPDCVDDGACMACQRSGGEATPQSGDESDTVRSAQASQLDTAPGTEGGCSVGLGSGSTSGKTVLALAAAILLMRWRGRRLL